MISSIDMVGPIRKRETSQMKRLLLMSAMAAILVVAACSELKPGSQAMAADSGPARVYMLSDSEMQADRQRLAQASTDQHQDASSARTCTTEIISKFAEHDHGSHTNDNNNDDSAQICAAGMEA